MSRFEGKTVLVTGGAQGIARATAEAFAAEGANLVLFDIEAETLGRTARELADKGWPVEGVAGDVSRREDVRGAVDRAVERFGRLDVLFAAAAVTEIRPLLEITDEVWDRIMAVNLRGVFLATQESARAMARTGGGAIVVIASTNAFFVEQDTVPYSTTKGGIVTFVRNAALDLAPHNVRINAINPGIIYTRLSAALIDDPVAGPEYLKRIPLARYGQPEDIARVALFLASDDAGYMTGEDVTADGGATLGVVLGIEDLGLPEPS